MILHRVLAGTETVAMFIAAVALALVALLTAAAVGLRAIGLNLPDAMEFSSLLLAVAVFWGLVSAVVHNALIRVDMLAAFLPLRAQSALAFLSLAVVALTFGFLAHAGVSQIALTWRSGEVTPELRIVLWPFLALGLCGLVVSAVVAFSILFKRANVGHDGRPADRTLAHDE